VHPVQSVAAVQVSGQKSEVHAHPLHVPSVGPDVVPSMQRVLSRHHPQPASAVHAPQVANVHAVLGAVHVPALHAKPASQREPEQHG
jgi:hypothetical protein